MPLENTIQGGVTETLACLLSSSPEPNAQAGPSKPRIVGEVILSIQHCLVAKKGVEMEDVRWVRSHEQVRARCGVFPVTRYAAMLWQLDR